MKFIPLTKGYQAAVDDADYLFVSQFKWTACVKLRKHSTLVYARRNIQRVGHQQYSLWLHRVLMNVTDSKIQVDHRDHDGLNCCRDNLRVATGTQNEGNQRIQGRPKSSRFKGVSWDKRTQNWMAYIKFHSKRKFLGRFDCEESAARAYDSAACELFGEYANLNCKEVAYAN
jgi:hypothetical protein